jgi:hypothetical protein
MDVNETRLRRELEKSDRLLHDREEEHSREVDGMRAKQRRQLSEMRDDSSAAVKKINEDAEARHQATRQRFEESLDKAKDSYEKSLADERSSNYNKLGRLQTDTQLDMARERTMRNSQIKDLVAANQHAQETQNKRNDAELMQARDRFDADRTKMKEYLDKKLAEQNRLSNEASSKIHEEARNKIDENIRSNDTRVFNEKLAADVRYKKLAEEDAALRDHLKESLATREKQLIREKSLAESGANHHGEKANQDYRQRSADTNQRLADDYHFALANKERENANRIALSETDHMNKNIAQQAAFRQRENDLKHQIDAERARNNLKEDLDTRRAKQENYLATEAIRKTNNNAIDLMKARHTEALNELNDKHQQQMLNYAKDTQNRMNEQETRNNGMRAELESEKVQQFSQESYNHSREKAALVKAYEDRQNSLNELNKRQIEQTEQAARSIVRTNRAAADKEISKNNRENQIKQFNLSQSARAQNEQAEARRQLDLETADTAYRERVRRLTDSYGRAVTTQKENFDEMTEAFRHESMTDFANYRHDSEHQQQIQMLDLQAKNRMLANGFESKLSRMEEQHNAELAKMKTDNDKAMRDVLRKTKETLETERRIHSYEMESKDRQMTDRLKLQEETFKDQIEKLKRTHELALKKS